MGMRLGVMHYAQNAKDHAAAIAAMAPTGDHGAAQG